MTRCNSVNVKLSNFQLKYRSEGTEGSEVTLKLSSNNIGDSNDETNFPNELLPTDRQVSKLRKA